MSDITVRIASLAEIEKVHRNVPELRESADFAGYLMRIDEADYLPLVAQQGEHLLGFKLGYALNPVTFYSWVGGVIPDFRGMGVALKLLEYQEAWARQQGYKVIQVKSREQFSAMRAMLSKHHYECLSTQTDDETGDMRYLFRKQLL